MDATAKRRMTSHFIPPQPSSHVMLFTCEAAISRAVRNAPRPEASTRAISQPPEGVTLATRNCYSGWPSGLNVNIRTIAVTGLPRSSCHSIRFPRNGAVPRQTSPESSGSR